jgi:hypothetical protein
MTTHRVLQIRETLDEISNHTTPYTNGDLFNLMQVNKLFSDAVVDRLWERQSSLLPLLKILPLEIDDKGILVSSQQWPRLILFH